ncbi:hypothetical protein ACLK1X_03865 [Escherichia coli]
MYEFDWSSIVPSLPYLLDGLGDHPENHRHGSRDWYFVGYHAGGDALVQLRAVFRGLPATLTYSADSFSLMVLLWFYLIVPGFLQNVLGLSPKNDIRLISVMAGVFDV